MAIADNEHSVVYCVKGIKRLCSNRVPSVAIIIIDDTACVAMNKLVICRNGGDYRLLCNGGPLIFKSISNACSDNSRGLDFCFSGSMLDVTAGHGVVTGCT